MIKTAYALISLLCAWTPALAAETLVTVPTAHTAKAAMDKLETLARSRGLTIFARVDHAGGARSIGETLRPTELLIMGHPKGGTPVLQCAQSFGIDLPLHVLAWQDAEGRNWLGYKALSKLGHSVRGAECHAALTRLSGALEGLVNEAARP